MIYTIGNWLNYQQARERYGDAIHKLEGGYAFLSVADALDEIIKTGHIHEWGIFGLDAEWERDTAMVDGEQYRVLTRDVPLIFLEESNQL